MRQAYHWGAKRLLAAMEVGETLEFYVYDLDINWDGLRQMGCRMAQGYGAKWVFRTARGVHKVTRVK